MPQRVLVNGVWQSFPDEATPEQITAALKGSAAGKTLSLGGKTEEVLGGMGAQLKDIATFPLSIPGAIKEAATRTPQLIENLKQPSKALGIAKENLQAIPKMLWESQTGTPEESGYRRAGRGIANAGLFMLPKGISALRGMGKGAPKPGSMPAAPPTNTSMTSTQFPLSAPTGFKMPAGKATLPQAAPPPAVKPPILPHEFSPVTAPAAPPTQPGMGPLRVQELVQKFGGKQGVASSASAPPPKASFPKSTSRQPDAAIRGATNLKVSDVAHVEQSIGDKFGTKPKLTGIRPTPEAIRTVKEGRAARHQSYKHQGEMNAAYKRGLQNEKGAIDPKLLVPAGLAGGGALVGAQMDKEHPIGGALLGGLAGGAAGLGAMNAPKLGSHALALRRDLMLTGRAIPQNLATAVGGAARASLEGGSMKPLREMSRLPTNAKTFAKAYKNPQFRGLTQEAGGGPIYPVTRIISAIDETARQALKRGGVDQPGIDRLLHTTPRGGLFPQNANYPHLQQAGKIIMPFQATPMNVLGSGIGEASNLFNPKTSMTTKALTVGSVPAGLAVEEVAARNLKKHPLLAAILAPSVIAALGPSSAIASASAIGASQGRGGRQRPPLGSLSPIPEFALNPALATRSGLGFKPALLHLLEQAKRQQ